MRLTITLFLVFFGGIAVGLAMRTGQESRMVSDRRGFGFRIDSGAPLAVAKVIDGDTIELENGLHVRLLGIDAPELGRYVEEFQPMGAQARDRLTQLIGDRPVRLEFGEERIDRYGRLLAHLYVDAPEVSSVTAPALAAKSAVAGSSGRIWLSEAMVQAGLARVYDYHDVKAIAGQSDPSIKQLQLDQQAAQAQHAGLWGLQRGDAAIEVGPDGRKWSYVAATDSEVFHRADSAEGLKIPADKLIGFPNRDAALQSGRRDAK